jgi:hypothetical protein
MISKEELSLFVMISAIITPPLGIPRMRISEELYFLISSLNTLANISAAAVLSLNFINVPSRTE